MSSPVCFFTKVSWNVDLHWTPHIGCYCRLNDRTAISMLKCYGMHFLHCFWSCTEFSQHLCSRTEDLKFAQRLRCLEVTLLTTAQPQQVNALMDRQSFLQLFSGEGHWYFWDGRRGGCQDGNVPSLDFCHIFVFFTEEEWSPSAPYASLNKRPSCGGSCKQMG